MKEVLCIITIKIVVTIINLKRKLYFKASIYLMLSNKIIHFKNKIITTIIKKIKIQSNDFFLFKFEHYFMLYTIIIK